MKSSLWKQCLYWHERFAEIVLPILILASCLFFVGKAFRYHKLYRSRVSASMLRWAITALAAAAMLILFDMTFHCPSLSRFVFFIGVQIVLGGTGILGIVRYHQGEECCIKTAAEAKAKS